MSKPRTLKTDFRGHDRWLLAAFLAGPLAVLSNVTVSYILSIESCTRGSKLMLHLSSAAFLLVALAAALIARRTGNRITAIELPDMRERIRWLANAAIVLALASAVVIVATEIPNLILRSCD